MRPLIIGILLFLIWSAFSTWYYVCHVHDFCIGSDVSPPVSSEETQTQTDSTSTTEAEPVEETIPVPENLIVHFAFDRSEFSPSEETSRFVSESKAYLEQEPDALLHITGHTDAIGTDAYNLALGMRRAESVLAYLSEQGIPAGQMETFSMGEEAPVADNATSQGRAENRRAETSFKTE